MKRDSKYKFEENLLKVSKNNDFKNALLEWNLIYKEEKSLKDEICICQHKISNASYYYNKNTQKIICIGLKCCEKFKKNMNNSNKLNILLHDLLERKLKNNEYTHIDNIFEYCVKIKDDLINELDNKINLLNEINKLINLKNEIEDLINNYEINYLQDLVDKIYEKIKKLELEIEERKRLQLEQEEIQIRLKQEEEERELKLEQEERQIRLEQEERKKMELEKEKMKEHKENEKKEKLKKEYEEKEKFIKKINNKNEINKEESHLDKSVSPMIHIEKDILEKQYLESLNDKEKRGYEIARSHLGSAFRLDKSIGYLQFINNWQIREK